jgi:heptosyltransferase I
LKILILKPSSLGDVVQAIPVLRLIKHHLPESQIHWWIESSLAPLLEGDSDLAGVIEFNRRGWAAPRNWRSLWQTVAWVRAQRFDWVIDLQCLARSGALAWLANGRLLAGLDEPREGARGYYDIIARRASYHTHAVDWYLSLLPLLKIPVHKQFDWLPPKKAPAETVARHLGQERGPWVLLQPGARWPNKRWPAESFSELVQQLRARMGNGIRFAVLGGREDTSIGESITRSNSERVLNLTGRLSLPELIECIRRGDLLITNDTGPMHVAAALGKPVLGLFGPTEPKRTGPYGQLKNVLQHSLPCVPCMKAYCTYPKPIECLRAISPAQTAERALHLLRSDKLLRHPREN